MSSVNKRRLLTLAVLVLNIALCVWSNIYLALYIINLVITTWWAVKKLGSVKALVIDIKRVFNILYV